MSSLPVLAATAPDGGENRSSLDSQVGWCAAMKGSYDIFTWGFAAGLWTATILFFVVGALK